MEQKSNGCWELDHEERALSMAQKDQVLHLGAGPWALSDVAHTTHSFIQTFRGVYMHHKLC